MGPGSVAGALGRQLGEAGGPDDPHHGDSSSLQGARGHISERIFPVGRVTGKEALGHHPAVVHGGDRPCWWHPGARPHPTHSPSLTDAVRGSPVSCGVLWAAS